MFSKVIGRGLIAALTTIAAAIAQEHAPDPAMLHALELQQAGDLDGAIAQYRDFLKAHPAALDARINMGVALAKQGHFEEAIKEYQAVLTREPNNTNALLDVALAHYKMNQVAPAVAPLTKLHQLQPGNMQALLLLADSETT
jgi:tetratricopeptide (TPR) repeat protein